MLRTEARSGVWLLLDDMVVKGARWLLRRSVKQY